MNKATKQPADISATISRYTEFLMKRSAWIIVFAIAIAAFCLPLAARIGLNANVIALLPEDAPSVRNLKRVLTKTIGQGDLMVMIESPSFECAVSYAESLLEKVKTRPWVGTAKIGEDMSFFDRNKMLFMSYADLLKLSSEVDRRIEREKLRQNPLYIDLSNSDSDTTSERFNLNEFEKKYKFYNNETSFRYFTNRNDTVLIMVIHPKGITSDIPFARRVHKEIVKLTEQQEPSSYHPEMKVSVGGTFVNRLNEYDTIVNDVRSSAVWVGVCIMLLIVLYFRHPASVIVIFLPLLISLTITFACAAQIVETLNIITVFLFIILFGLGIDFGIHLLAQYREERRVGKRVEPALQATLKTAGRAALVSAATTALAFMVLTFSSFRGFSEFGIIAGTGLLFSTICYLIVLPAIIVQIEKRCSLVPRLIKPHTPASFHLTFKHPRFVLLLAAMLTLTSIWSMKDLQFEYDFRNLRANISSTREFNKKMREVFAMPRDPAIILVDDLKEAEALARVIRQKIALGEQGGNNTVQSVKTLNDFLPVSQREKLVIIAKMKQQIEKYYSLFSTDLRSQIDHFRTALNVKPVAVDTLPLYVKEQFLGRDSSDGQLVYIYQTKSLLDVRNALEFSNEVNNLQVEERRYQAAGEPIVYSAMFQGLKVESVPILILVAIAIIGTVFVDVKGWKSTLLSLSPLLIGLLWMIGAMAALEIKLNLLNAVVLPCIMGIGVDGGVHLFHQYWDGKPRELTERLQITAKSVAICTATSMIGFGGMITAEHPGLRSIGSAALIGLSTVLAASIFFYPTLLIFLSDKRPKSNERK